MTISPGQKRRTKRFSVEEYHRMAESGILSEDDRVELIEGEIVEMTPIGSQHAGIVNILNRLFTQEFSAKAVVSVQNPIRLDQYSEPEPDLAVLAWRDDHYQSRQPEPRDVKLIVEVSDTSVERDRRDKASLYASFGIPCVWLVDVESKTVESFYSPDGDSYRDVATKRQAEMIPVPSIDDFELSPSDIFLE